MATQASQSASTPVSPRCEAPSVASPLEDEVTLVPRRIRLRSTDSTDGSAPFKSARLEAPNAPRIGAMVSTPTPEALKAGRRPAMRLDLNDLPSFTVHRASSNTPTEPPSASSSTAVSPTVARSLRPIRPKLVSRFSSDDSIASRRTPAALTPGTQDALFAFGIASGNRSGLSTPATEFAPPMMARSRSAGRMRSGLSVPATPALVDCDGANALFDALLPSVPRNSESHSPVLCRSPALSPVLPSPPVMARTYSNPYFASAVY